MWKWLIVLACLSAYTCGVLSLGAREAVVEEKTTPQKPEDIVVARASSVTVGDAQHFGGLMIFPLIGSSLKGDDYFTLDEAIKLDLIKVREKGSGDVNLVVLQNYAGRPVFIMDGEEIVGAKQNRTINSSVMIGTKQIAEIPVSCVEQGRWVAVSSEFKSGETQLFASARQMNSVAVTDNYKAVPSAGPQSDQSMIWSKVAAKRAAIPACEGATDAMHEVYSVRQDDINQYLKHFEVVDGQVGAVFAIGGKIIGADIFDRHSTLEKLFPKLVKSYGLDAVDLDDKDNQVLPTKADAEAFIKRIKKSDVELQSYESPGEGNDVRIKSDIINGHGLVFNGKAVHVVLFAPVDASDDSAKVNQIAPASERRHRLTE